MIDINQLGQGGFSFPSQWGTASDIWNYFGTGGTTQIPQQWQLGSSLAGQMAQTGQPTTTGNWWQKTKEAAQYDITDMIKQAVAGYSARNPSAAWASPVGQQAADITARTMAGLAPQWVGMELGAQEAAKGRQMQALPMMYQFGAGTAGLTESAKDRAMQAAGGLAGLGQQYANLPQQTAMNQMQMAQMLQNMQQQAFQPYYQQWQYGQPWNNPWLQYGMQGANMPFSQMPQMYDPSVMAQFMNMFSNIAPYAMMGG